MSPPINLSVNEAIQQLRAEIIAPDWQLSPQRIARLREALKTLTSVFSNRAHALALIKMAESVVDHIEKGGNQTSAIDFLKEDLAHIVALYDEDSYDPAHEKEKASRAYKRFMRLGITLSKDKIRTANQTVNTSLFLEKLTSLAHEADQLHALLGQSGTLSADEGRQAEELLGKISAAINIVWAHIPTANRE